MAGFSQLCTTREWHVHQTRSAKIDTTRISGIAENFNFWPTGKVITVGFVNGTTEQRVAVLAIAKEWEKHGNIRFEAADVKDAIVRIRLTHSGANYTYIGTDILKADPGENNMQLDQSLFGKNHAELRKVVLHQFGHVLGMVHEFNPPDEGAQWDKVHIQKEFRRAGWSALDIENNLYGLYTHRITNGWFWDRHSIMHLGIAYRHLNKGIPIYVNEEISEGDSMWLGSRYPFVNSGINKRPPFTLSL
ncbi:MAG: M12 family metallopeptidase [Chitinophagaceae bacterium]|nr:M12 family metallopeptidase [Chitinophagaceae bacterium]